MDDLELQRLEAVVDAVPAVLDLLFADDQGHDGRVIELSVAFDILKGRNISDEDIEYVSGPWAVGESDSSVDVAGPWHFPSPDVSNEPEVKLPIVIVPLKEGYVVEDGEFKVGEAAFTDAVDLADWLLEWLGLSHYHERRRNQENAYEKALDVVMAAQAYVEGVAAGEHTAEFAVAYDMMEEAVNKWRGIGSKKSED